MTTNSKTIRNGGSGTFILGVHGFARICAVEGIVAPKRLMEDLRRLENASPEARCAALASIYGTKN